MRAAPRIACLFPAAANRPQPGNALARYARSIGLVALLLIIGCSPTVRVEPPDRPIEINLNVRIEQEVRIRIDRELEQVFEENEELF